MCCPFHPTPGGIGTTIFYIVGAVLVLGAAAVILARRKAEQE
ncbi:MAG: LPXTG cell wall anchor domain-containing protein [Clostridia bacterium]|nr:LPXTG cell wall anchor domain-containing protein [Clostridia bacterium]